MQITIDTSALIAVITNEASKEKIIEITKDCNVCAPMSVHWEMGNAFSAMVKRHQVPVDLAKQCLNAYRRIPIKFIDVTLEPMLDLSEQLNIYAYDAYVIRCAQQTGSSIVTLDRRLKLVARSIGIHIHEIGRSPTSP